MLIDEIILCCYIENAALPTVINDVEMDTMIKSVMRNIPIMPKVPDGSLDVVFAKSIIPTVLGNQLHMEGAKPLITTIPVVVTNGDERGEHLATGTEIGRAIVLPMKLFASARRQSSSRHGQQQPLKSSPPRQSLKDAPLSKVPKKISVVDTLRLKVKERLASKVEEMQMPLKQVGRNTSFLL